ncbi:MAG TPA: hypothetical protein VIC29_15355 [Steroidobacteraceae bacterium]|jgi:hypothetical protein
MGRRWINILWAIPLVVALLIGAAVGPAAHDAQRAGIHRAIPGRHPSSRAVYPVSPAARYNEDHEFYGYRMPI